MNYNDQILSHTPLILIVDDNPHNLQVLGKQLKENNYNVEFAISGEVALTWLNNKQFDLILLDINMPVMSGFEVCQQIRSNPDMNNVPIIFLSAETDRESILKGFDLGAQDYITKPFDSRELIVRVRTQLMLKQSLESLESLNKSLEEKVLERTHQLKEANDKLEATNLKLIDLDKAKSEFLNLISHEIRTPLNGILGLLELLKDPSYASELGESKELINILDVSVKRLEKFALDALLITRLKTKQYQIKRNKNLLSDLISEVLEEEKNNSLQKNIKINFEFDPDSDCILGEADLIKKCFTNVLDNAISHSPQNGYINISGFLKDGKSIIEFHDQGKGFSSDLTDRALELFIRGKECTDNCPGIGLPVVKMIMELHDGDIILNNHPDGGALVKLLFLNNPQN